ncbi:hypothetical protein BDV36DRAFT_308311 [Aspergillus pseudocaelatus]|uniref:Nucleotide-diphospho-sugar transferase n=1 Tax=Aspergillus pseudocaelatus TaxID=1825620 RepID=A0ABQ6WP44_9EURO|nr:hypothetical protein BDV36DRAFT_308311 [Aspergillus pseudocaelatus]
MVSRARYRQLTFLSASLIVCLGLLAFSNRHRHVPVVASLKERYPLLWKHPNPDPQTIIEAAQLAIQATESGEARCAVPHSLIPLIIHQTWGHRRIDTWPEDSRQSVERWLQFVVEDGMAYFLWEDEGMVDFIDHFAPESHEHYASLPSMVEKTDYFRILVATLVGGIYGDLDTVPLKSPAQWITSQDILPWTDLETRSVYKSTKPVRAIFSIEADCLPTDHTCWRMGYPDSIQLTQWSFASTRDHPLLHRYLENLAHQLQTIANQYGGLQTSAARTELQALDPLTLTGPEALTYAVKEWLNVSARFRWNALTGLQDGGKAKLVDDVLILPITSFSPGRGRYGNMGSKPITDPTALVHHRGQGSSGYTRPNK